MKKWKILGIVSVCSVFGISILTCVAIIANNTNHTNRRHIAMFVGPHEFTNYEGFIEQSNNPFYLETNLISYIYGDREDHFRVIILSSDHHNYFHATSEKSDSQ
jgi:hypothetical protein